VTTEKGNIRRYIPRLIAWEVTRACRMACKHCRAAARPTPDPDDLTTEEGCRLLENIASFARPIIILTGGEPLLRPDIFDLAAHARDLGLPVALATCGTALDERVSTGDSTWRAAERLAGSGVRHISISLDGASAESHDAIRGVPGAFEAAVGGIEAAKRAGLAFQINTTVARHNVEEVPAILELAVSLGASVFNPFLFVPTGRGREIADEELSADQYEETLTWLADQRGRRETRIRVTCAPQFQRIIRERRRPGDPEPPSDAGCMGGKSFAFVSHSGKVQICGFLDVECGDLRRENFDLRKIWETSDVFRRVRDVGAYGGRCGRCEYNAVCGGCRARAYAMTGDYLSEEPFCIYRPAHSTSTPRKPTPLSNLDKLDRTILAFVQADFPAAACPFEVLAARLGVAPQECLARVHRLVDSGFIRRIGPIFNSRRLGYTSTLVAARAPAERLKEIAQQVSRLPGVTHNYERRHPYNLWFTLTARSEEEIERTLAALGRETGLEFHSLPALAVYKIRAVFAEAKKTPGVFSAQHPSGPSGKRHLESFSPLPPVRLTKGEKELVRALQVGLAVAAEPFAPAAERVGRPVEEVLRQIEAWLDSGVVRRFGAIADHRQLGFRANGMAVFNIPPERIDAAGRRLAERPEITHCYRRPPLPDFPYTLYAMVHGRTEDEVRALVSGMAEEHNLTDYDVLFSVTEFKKAPMQYFPDDEAS